jgi:hypothetical protein
MPARVRLPTVGAVGRLSIFGESISRYPCWLALAGISLLTGVSLFSPDIPGFPFANVGSMTTCQVLRCQHPGSTVITGGEYLNDIHEAFICAEHRAEIDAGARWDIQDSRVLLGQDMPPAFAGWEVRDSVGTEGLRVTLNASGQAKPFEVFLTKAEAKMLSLIFSGE